MTAKKRNYGIDLLRIVSMIMVITLHLLRRGGILDANASLTLNQGVLCFLEAASFCAVNCYALVSGYVGFGKAFRLSRLIQLWFEVVFYLLTINLLFLVLVPSSVGKMQIITSFLPVTSNKYWYFTSYFAMFLFTPVFNYLVDTLSFKKMTLVVLTCISVFSVLPLISGGQILGGDIFALKEGYSPLWLSVLYIIGAYVKKYRLHNKLRQRTALITYFVCVLITLFSKLFIQFFSQYFTKLLSLQNILLSYTSPTVLFSAIALFIFFTKLNINVPAAKVISFFTTATFGVYIIQLHPSVWSFAKNKFAIYSSFNVFVMVLSLLGTALAFWLLFSLADKVRQAIFKLIRIHLLSEKIEALIKKLSRYIPAPKVSP